MKKCAIILCGGLGSRAGLGYNKIFYPLGQKNVLETIIDKFLDWDRIVVVINKEDKSMHNTQIVSLHNDCQFIIGGEARSHSVFNGLKAAKGCDIVAIHDGARPFVNKSLIERTLKSAIEFGSGIPAIKITDSIKKVIDKKIDSTIPKNDLVSAQTPQIFKFDEIFHAYNNLPPDQLNYEDDSQVYKLAKFTPHIVEGDVINKKLTNPSDFLPINAKKIGAGFDVHQLVSNRDLILGGVKLKHNKGLLGHSDADVLTHAIMDALLSSAGLKDIGHQFPDNDSNFKNVNSIELLKKVMILLEEKNINIQFVSAVIIAQEPKIAPFIDAIINNLSRVFKLDKQYINISATTTEFMGIIGQGTAIAASAVCLCDSI
ncbi:MAG: 2-C-methyl-D-erythritol 2,4-cyclodiphosphate synthase [Firmicutes bacterium]|nr:2-C-methyl-D-erythritol 2,4-cyclodiphosphate synthase [Bacillota bacterium]